MIDIPVKAVAVAEQIAAPDDTSTIGGVSALTTTSFANSFSAGKKPPSSRVIVDISSTASMLESHLYPCPKCEGRLKLSFPTVCIASGVELKCVFYGLEDGDCSFVVESKPAPATLSRPTHTENGCRNPSVERNTDHAANILFVLAFIASGDG